jgi:CTP synthase
VDREAVISAYDVSSTIYEIPLIFHEQKLDTIALSKLKMKAGKADLTRWERMVRSYKEADRTVRIGIVGKYIELNDSYKSIHEALYHGGIANEAQVELVKIDSETLEEPEDLSPYFRQVDGLLIPGGFGQRGILGMVRAARYAREQKLPCFGICLGMQVMVIEYARTILGLSQADSTEFSPESPHPVVSLLEEQVDVTMYGGTMRLGTNDTILQPKTKIRSVYGSEHIRERHRHRYEISNQYRSRLAEAGLIISGTTRENALVESVEWPEHPWGVGVQFHPEFTSTPIEPHPLFASFIAAALAHGSHEST